MEQRNPPPDRTKGSNETTPSATSIGVARSKNQEVTDICRTNRINDKAASSLLVHVYPLAMTTLWTPLQRCGKPPTTKRRKNTAKRGNALSAANRDTLHASALQRRTGRCRTTAPSKQRTLKPTMTSPTSASTQKYWRLVQCGCPMKIKTLLC